MPAPPRSHRTPRFSPEFNEGIQFDTKEEFPIFLEGLEVGKVVIQLDHEKATQAASEAAFDISRTNQVLFSFFSDGSYQKGRGGVALVYRMQWLPNGWMDFRSNRHAFKRGLF